MFQHTCSIIIIILDTGGSLLLKISLRGNINKTARYTKRSPSQIGSITLDAVARVETQEINNGYARSACNCIIIQVTTTTEVFPNAQVIIEKSTTNLELTRRYRITLLESRD
jgi:hypothetical protein